MKPLLTTLCLLCSVLGGSCARHAETPKPLLVVITYQAWNNPIGSDSPIFALYDDGTIICRLKSAHDEYPPAEKLFTTRKVENPEKKAAQLLASSLADAKAYYALSGATDQNLTVIWTPSKTVQIYGDWKTPRQFDSSWKENPRLQGIVESETDLWKSFPDEIRQALLRIENENTIAGAPWLPEKIEVMFWPYEYAPEESIIWPKEWPSLSSKDTRRRGEDSYSVFVPSQKFPELRTFLESRNPRGAVLIDGKKMADAYRFPFPEEKLWQPKPQESSQ